MTGVILITCKVLKKKNIMKRYTNVNVSVIINITLDMLPKDTFVFIISDHNSNKNLYSHNQEGKPILFHLKEDSSTK